MSHVTFRATYVTYSTCFVASISIGFGSLLGEQFVVNSTNAYPLTMKTPPKKHGLVVDRNLKIYCMVPDQQDGMMFDVDVGSNYIQVHIWYVTHIYIHIYIYTYIYIYIYVCIRARQTGRQADRQIGQLVSQIDKQIDRIHQIIAQPEMASPSESFACTSCTLRRQNPLRDGSKAWQFVPQAPSVPFGAFLSGRDFCGMVPMIRRSLWLVR